MSKDYTTVKMILRRVDEMDKYILFSYFRFVSGNFSYSLCNKGLINWMLKWTRKKLGLPLYNKFVFNVVLINLEMINLQ